MKKSLLVVFLLNCIYFIYKKNIKFKLKDYTKYALYMAVLDDEICRKELDGILVNGEKVEFPSKMDSLKYRYNLFLQLNRGKSKIEVQKEIKKLENRLNKV